MTEVVSPELALVDPELRAEWMHALPPIEPYGFLRFERRPVTAPAVAVPDSDRPPLSLAALAYAAATIAEFAIVAVFAVAAVTAIVLILSVLG